MKKSLIFATSNPHKLQEVRAILSSHYEILGLHDIQFNESLPETQDTIEGNAIQKAEYLHQALNMDCFADDTGLEIDALHGAPGVYSARYAGEPADHLKNMEKVRQELEGAQDRKARFRTVIALYLDGELSTFEGIVEGHILGQPRGTGGFGYDPIFVPDGYDLSFGELPSSVKNQISHRAKATEKLISFLNAKAQE